MVIVDSSVWIDFLNQRLTAETRWLSAAHNLTTVGLTPLVLAEVLQGIRHDGRFRQDELFFRSIRFVGTLDYSLAVHAARNFRTLRALGITIRSTVDCIIATVCIEAGHQLLHCDSDFDHFERHLRLTVLHAPPLSIP